MPADRVTGATTYLTIARDGQAEIEVKRSRFVCDLRRVDNEEAARDVLAAIRKQHWDAGHHCSAMIIGADASLERSNDDGEPSGTAGAPMLEVLRGHAISDVVAIVTRWFGGTLLGSGGLARAYGDGVRAALDELPLVRRSLVEEFIVAVEHDRAGRVENDLRSRGVQVLTTEYAERALILVGAAAGRRHELESTLAEVMSEHVDLIPAGSGWVDSAL